MGISVHDTAFIAFKYHYSLIFFYYDKISGRDKTVQRMLNPYGTFGICFGNNFIILNNNHPDNRYSWTSWNRYPEHEGDVVIVPGAAQKSNLIHYYPPRIAVPVGTTVAWFNNDPEQPHTVTSGSFGAPDSGVLFNSGVMPALNGVPFQYTFDKAGSVLYHCEIHPWRVGIVSVNAITDRGTNFEFSSGVGPIWNLTKDSRTLLDFTPLTIPLDLSTPITYNITMFKNSITNKVFSKTFTVPGDKLPLELIAGGYANHTRVYGPDFSSSGAYHLQAPSLKVIQTIF